MDSKFLNSNTEPSPFRPSNLELGQAVLDIRQLFVQVEFVHGGVFLVVEIVLVKQGFLGAALLHAHFSAQRRIVDFAYLDLLLLLAQHAHVEREGLKLFYQHLKRFGRAGLRYVVALDQRLVSLHAAHHVVGLKGEYFLKHMRRAVRLQRPHLHLAEALAAELRLAAQRLLGDQ